MSLCGSNANLSNRTLSVMLIVVSVLMFVMLSTILVVYSHMIVALIISGSGLTTTFLCGVEALERKENSSLVRLLRKCDMFLTVTSYIVSSSFFMFLLVWLVSGDDIMNAPTTNTVLHGADSLRGVWNQPITGLVVALAILDAMAVLIIMKKATSPHSTHQDMGPPTEVIIPLMTVG